MPLKNLHLSGFLRIWLLCSLALKVVVKIAFFGRLVELCHIFCPIIVTSDIGRGASDSEFRFQSAVKVRHSAFRRRNLFFYKL